MKYHVVLKNLVTNQSMVIDPHTGGYTSKGIAEQYRKSLRRVLGGKHWTVDRRPGLDTLDHLALTVISGDELKEYEDESTSALKKAARTIAAYKAAATKRATA